jgi:D-proline reductase (dithiol) PrdB
MTSLSDLPVTHRLFLKAYRWRALDPVPFARPGKPLAELKLALVATGGLSAPGQSPFDETLRGGDPSSRLVRGSIDVATLAIHQRSEDFDHSGFERDRNLGFPLDRLREMSARGEIGPLAPRHLSFVGSITAPGRLMKQTAPAAAEELQADGVEAALLVPL